MADVTFTKVPTGRTHQVGGGAYEPILGADGEPEQEWALAAIVDGHLVVLQTVSVGHVEHMVGRPDTAIDESSDDESSSGEQSSSGSGSSTAGDANAGDQPPS